jgi:hypothetical protein
MNSKSLAIAVVGLTGVGLVQGQPFASVGDSRTMDGVSNVSSPHTELTNAGSQAAKRGLVPLFIRLPPPPVGNTFVKVEANEHLAFPSTRPRPPLMVPPGTTNLAVNRPVMSSDPSPYDGKPDEITAGAAAHGDKNVILVLHRGPEWVQVDLGDKHALYAVAVWHSIWPHKIVHGVVVQVADDAKFTQNVRTVFNDDYKNIVGLGAGEDKEYYETFEGKLIALAGLPARYVRLYSAGSTQGGENTYLAIEVYGVKNGVNPQGAGE